MMSTLPLRSRSVRAGKFLLPGWWGTAFLALAALCIVAAMGFHDMLPAWLTQDLPRWLSWPLPTSLEFHHIGQGAIFAACATFFELLLIVLLVHVRYNRSAEVIVHTDRLELRQDSEKEQTIRWRDILRQDERNDDIWLEQQGSGKSAFNMIRFDVVDEGKRRAIRLFCHLNPLGRIAPTFANVQELRRAFLLSALRAQPSLRAAEDVYALCEVHPVTLRSSSMRKWAGRLNFSLSMALALLSLATVLTNADSHTGWLFIVEAIGALILSLLISLMIGTWLLSVLFVAPQDPRAVTARSRMPGGAKGSMRSTRDYPIPDNDIPGQERRSKPVGMEWMEALVARRRPDDECPWHVLEGWDWSRLLAERPELADRCPWDKLDGEDWSCLLSEQPTFAEDCRWEKLAPSDWATLLASQPQFFETGQGRFRWQEFEGSDWSELLGTQPQFSQYCNFSTLGGTDWAFLLREQPQFAHRCSWEKLDEDDWKILLAVQPQFESNRKVRTRGGN
jgi:hypothetical protein